MMRSRRHPKRGLQWLKSEEGDKFLRKLGMARVEREFIFPIFKSLFYGACIWGAVWWFNETSPLGWFRIHPWYTKEEKELKHRYECVDYPYPGDEEAMKEFINKGGLIGTVFDPKGNLLADKEDPFRMKDEKFEQEAQKMWMRMRNEVISEMLDKGFDME